MAPHKPRSAAPSAKNAPTAEARRQAAWGWKRRRRWQLFAGRKRVPCCFCGRLLTLDQATMEHVVPRSQGGPNVLENLEISCSPCNQERGVTEFDEFRKRKEQERCAR